MGNIVRKLPIGIQSFDKLRTENYLYVDKTEFIYQMAYQGVPYFLSRPRRFGKSLLLSTFKAYFEGKKELFRGLAIEKLETEWKEHPVLHFSLNAELYDSRKALENMLERQLREWEKIYDTGGEGITYSGRFMTIIRRAAEITGRKVVVLIDEYDKPLLRNLHNEELQNEFRELLTAFYTVLKDADPWLRFVFITGVTKFAQVGIFSNLNHLNDISLAPQYAALCGMTLPEIEATFQPELHALAEANKLSYEGIIEKITRRYDGYHFDFRSGIALYNPFSVLNVLSKQVFYDYWFASGTPTFLAEMLRKTNYDIRELDGIEVSEVSLSDDRANINNPVPMIYQSGYLTIKSYDERFRLYTLGYPNEEVKYGFLNFVASMYAHLPETRDSFLYREVHPRAGERKRRGFPHPPKGFLRRYPLRVERPDRTSLPSGLLHRIQATRAIHRGRGTFGPRTCRCHRKNSSLHLRIRVQAERNSGRSDPANRRSRLSDSLYGRRTGSSQSGGRFRRNHSQLR